MVKDFVNKARLESLKKKSELFAEVAETGDLADTHRRDEFMADLLAVTMDVLSSDNVNLQNASLAKELEQTNRSTRVVSFLDFKHKKACTM